MSSETTRVDKPEPSLQSEQAEQEQCKYKKCSPGDLPRPRYIYPSYTKV